LRMQSGTGRLHLFAETRRRNQALGVGAGICIFVYCALALGLGLGLGLDDVAQPRRYQGPEPVPHPSITTVQIALEGQLPISNDAARSAPIELARPSELGGETVGQAAPEPQAEQKSDRTVSSRRTHVARRKTTHIPMQDYASQPFFGNYPPGKTTHNPRQGYAARPFFSNNPPRH
jgi:hypothetical protein